MFGIDKCKYIKKYLRCLISIILVFNLTACKVEKKDVKKESLNSSKEYYSRIEVEMPEKLEAKDIAEDTEGGLYVVAKKNESCYSLWHFGEDDKWERKYDLGELLSIEEAFYCNAYVSSDGELFVAYNKNVDGNNEFDIDCGENQYCFVDKSGNVIDVDMKLPELNAIMQKELETYYGKKAEYKNTINIVRFIDDKIYISDINSNIYEYDKKNFGLECVYENVDSEYINEFSIYDRTIMMWVEGILYFEGLDSHEKEQSMSDRFLTFFGIAKQNSNDIKMSIENNSLYTISCDKLCKYNLADDSFTTNKILGYSEGEIYLNFALSGESVYIVTSTINKQHNILSKLVLGTSDATCEDMDENELSDASTLKIWALEQGKTFETAVRCFTDKYPNVNVEIEIGMADRDSGITEMDAIKNLNSELLAGNGPDIIYMDGLKYEKFIESGMLYNIAELVSKLEENGDYFNNILETFKDDDELYLIPSSFSLVEKVGKSDIIKISEDFSAFADYVEKSKLDRDVIYEDSVTYYIMLEYYKEFQKDIKSGIIDEQRLGEYFEASKKLYVNAGSDDIKPNAFIMYMPIDNSGAYNTYGTFDFEISNKGSISDGQKYSQSMANEIKGEIEFPAKDYKDRYIVHDCMAISAECANIDLAESYLEIAIGKECQEQLNGAKAFRVNREGLRKYTQNAYNIRHEDAGSTETDAGLTCLDDFVCKCELLREPIFVDMVLDQIVFDELNQYIQGKVEKNEAVDNLIEKLNIYISE